EDIIKDVIEANSSDSNSEYSAFCSLKKDAQGTQIINVTGQAPFEVLCENIAGPGWTTVALRSSGEMNFFRDWDSYKTGFGNLTGEFFIGLDKLHAITTSQQQELYIHLEDFNGHSNYARYDDFLIGSESEKYAILRIGKYVGTAGDSLQEHLNAKFSTFDSDNDSNETSNLAAQSLGGWWYTDKLDSNLFGQYLKGKYDDELNNKGMFWDSWLGTSFSFKVMKMLLRPRCPCLY
ncbi:hypothetical protein KR222_009544, partial [Zaprionus bogoriensis]